MGTTGFLDALSAILAIVSGDLFYAGFTVIVVSHVLYLDVRVTAGH